MPAVIADGRIKLTALTTKPAKPEAPTIAELNAGVDLQEKILKSDYKLSATASDTVNDAVLAATGNAVTFGSSNYEGSVTPLRYLDETGKAIANEDDAWELLKTKGSTMWLAEREGPEHSKEWEAGDEISVYEVITDDPQKPSERTGYIKRVVPLGVQRAWENKKVAS